MADGKGDSFENNVRIHDVGVTNYRLFRFLKTSDAIFRKALELDCSIYHFHDPDFIFGAVLLKLKGKKVIYDIHEDVPRDILSKDYLGIFRKPVSIIFEWFENWAAKKFDSLVTATPYIKERFDKINKNTWCVNNYPLQSEISGNRYTNDEQPTPLRIAYIGGISKIRGICELIDALERIPIQLELAGEFENEDIKKQIVSKQAWNKVNYYGNVNRKKVKEIMNKCIAGVVTFHPEPNHINAQPNKIFEYMSSGLAVVCSHFEMWKRLIDSHQCGVYADPQDAMSIAAAISQIIKDINKTYEMGKNGLKAVREQFNWDIEKIKLFEAYSFVLKQ
ncbi:MAG: glycosyltransferase [Bacteroidetes bacterium]|nr:glycosyltransferase [Bacteroidota bacterium]